MDKRNCLQIEWIPCKGRPTRQSANDRQNHNWMLEHIYRFSFAGVLLAGGVITPLPQGPPDSHAGVGPPGPERTDDAL